MSTPLRERPDAPLGTLIFRAGLLPAETIESALEEGVKTGKRLGEILTERGLISEVDLARLLAGQKGLEFVTLREQIVDTAAASLFTEEQARLFRALPYSFDGELPVVAIADPTDEVLIRNIREALGREDARFVVTARGELAEIAADVYSRPLTPPQPEAAPEPEAEPVAEPAAEAEAPPAPVEEPETETAPLSEHLNGNATVDAELIVAAPTYEPAPVPQPEPAPVVPEPEPEPAAFQVPAPVAPAAPEPLATPEPAADAAQPPSAAPEKPAGEPAALAPEPPVSPEPAPVPEPAAVPEAPAAPEPPALVQPVAAPTFPAAPEPSPALETPTPEPAASPEPVPFPDPEPAPSPPSYPPAAAAPETAPPPIPEEPETTPTAPEPTVVSIPWRLTIRLTNGERVEAGDFADQESAKQEAKAVMAQVADADSGEWPFVSGRFLKPDTIVSVDIAELSGDET